MADKVVKITFEIDGLQQSFGSIEEAKSALTNLDKEAKKAEKSLEDAGDAAKDLGDKAKESGEAGEGAIKVLDEATGGLATKVKEVGGGFVSMGKKAWGALMQMVKGSRLAAGALAATGIGAIVVAVGLLMSYWDNILDSVNGVSSAARKNLEATEATAEAAQENLEALDASENSLKLQGKSEKEIRDLKIQQTNETITALEAQLQAQQTLKDEQVAGAKRNKAILEGILKAISAPIALILEMYDYLTGSNTTEKVYGSIAGLMFDPEEVESEGEATIKETEKQLQGLRSKRDGYLLQEKEQNKKAATEKVDNEKDLNAELAKLRAENIADAEQKALALLEIQRAAERQALVDKKASAELLAEFDKQTEMQRNAIIDQYAKEREEKRKAEEEKYLANRQTINDLLQQANLDAIDDQFERARQELKIQEDLDLEKLRMAGATEAEINRIKASYTKKNKELDQEEADFKKQLREADVDAALSAASDVFGTVSGLLKEGSAAAKAASIAQTTIDTYQSATAAYKSVVGIPVVGPVLAPIAAGVAVAAGLASIKKIVATKVPGDGASGSVPSISVPTGTPVDPNAAIASAAAGQQGDNQITLGQQQGSTGATVIKAYVVSTDMSTQQEADKKINDLARL